MKKLKLVLLTGTICLSMALPLLIFGLRVPYTQASEFHEIPDVKEIIFKESSQEIQNIYDLNLVTIIVNGIPKRVLTNRVDVQRLLADIGVIVDNNKKIVSTTETVQDNTIVRVITIGTVIEEQKIEVPYKTESINTKEIPYGETRVTQKGVLGVRTKEIEKVYEDGVLVSESILNEEIVREPVKEVVEVGVLQYKVEDLDTRYGYNCNHWYEVVDQADYTEQEKQWLKFVMYCESGCNAENNKHSTYKGLFQWNPRYWNTFFPKDNIFDGYAQIANTVTKVRQGVNMSSYWPSCHSKYVSKYGEFKR